MGRHPFSIPAIHQKYSEASDKFLRAVKSPALRLMAKNELDSFIRSCAAGLWACGEGAGPRQVEVMNAIYSCGPAPDYLYFELSSQVEGYGGFSPPPFFARMAVEEAESARSFPPYFSEMLSLFAEADGQMTRKEESFIAACTKELTALLEGRERRTPTPSGAGAKAGMDSGAGQTSGTNGETNDSGGKTDTPDQKMDGKAETSEKEPEKDLESLLKELDGLCGLSQVKKDVKSLIHLARVRKLREEQNLPVLPMSLHLVFMGGPGTGKTTVARLLSEIYRAVGVLSKGQLVEVDRTGLVAGYVGQTALKTGEAIRKALGGVLFIDEAYALTRSESGNDFGQEAIEVLLKGMEDNRNDLVVIAAGYTDLMEEFISSNPGLKSRFNKYIYFEDYTGAQLYEIFCSMCEKHGYKPDEEAKEYAKDLFEKLYLGRDLNFGNAREVRNIFEKAVSCQSDRLFSLQNPSRGDLMTITAQDLSSAVRSEEKEEPS